MFLLLASLFLPSKVFAMGGMDKAVLWSPRAAYHGGA